MRNLFSIALLLGMLVIIYYYNERDSRIETTGKNIVASDGDSFILGEGRIRLKGIDAPELHQNCAEANGRPWACGVEARSALAKMLSQPGLACSAGAADRFHRKLATCSTGSIPDIGAAMVSAGWAISEDFGEMREYPDEEDAAKEAKRGIWRGNFERPRAWRDAHPR